MHYAIIQAQFNKEITEGLLSGALLAFSENKIARKNIKVFKVPGTWEIPYMAQELARAKKFKAIITLAAVIKGETSHDHWINHAVFPSLQQLAIQHNLPITLGIITCSTWKQAQARSGNDKENRGYTAALAAIKMTQSEIKN